ncbi:MAG: hypothetical protein KBD01_15775 [Acidobacteria bacterium]|nr:hypothetical protein [Acidobacteriota bacterium]
MRSGTRCLAAFVLASFVCTAAFAQWSSDPAVNTPVAVKTGEQSQPKVHATSDGGCYISWYDSETGGYDMFLQRLDAAGVPQWAAGGIMLLDSNESSTQDYGLDVDASDNALVTFRDDRSGNIQITATKISPAGAQLWGPNGVQVSAGTAGKNAPKIAATSDGAVVVAWTPDTPKEIRLQRLDADGAPLWGSGISLPTAATFSLADLQASDNGSVILSWVRYETFNGPKHLWTNKLSSTGTRLWGTNHVRVLDGTGSLQMGNFPPLVPDGHGGAVYAWYTVDPLQCFVQRVLAAGTEAFTHNGLPVSTDVSRPRTAPSAAFNPATNEIFVFWDEQSGIQYAVYGQKFDEAGARQWTNSGAQASSFSSNVISWVRTLVIGSGAFTFWIDEQAYQQQRVYGARLDASGAVDCPVFPVSSLLASKSRLAAWMSPLTVALLAWDDSRNDFSDIYAQNVQASCGLGWLPAEVSPPGAVQPLVFTDADTMVWDDKSASGCESFNVYRGDAATLGADDYGTCYESSLTASTCDDPWVPDPGAAATYLVTGRSGSGEGTLGNKSSGEGRPNAHPCP